MNTLAWINLIEGILWFAPRGKYYITADHEQIEAAFDCPGCFYPVTEGSKWQLVSIKAHQSGSKF